MSRVAYFDAASGASGDMLLGALVDLGLPLETLRAELARLPLAGYRLESRRVERSGLMACKVDVVIDGELIAHSEHAHPHDHSHHDHHHEHAHRGLREILDLLDHSSLDDVVKRRAGDLFRRLAEAEAQVHGKSPEEIHFHEVGAVDSIVDVVGGVIGLHWLGAERVVCSPLNLGTGTVTMSHGTFPVPAPATALLVRGVPIFAAGEGELLTPTGALLLTGHASEYGPLPPLRPLAFGYGAGTRDTVGRPNVLRVIVGEAEGATAAADGIVTVLEAEVDDMSGQLLGHLMERLFEVGALDAFFTPIHMKKGRPGILVSVLCEPAVRETIETTLFAESTTLGVRRHDCARSVLERESVRVATAYGPIGVKLGRRAGRVLNAQPEFEDCRLAASTYGVAVKEVWAAAVAAWRQKEAESR